LRALLASRDADKIDKIRNLILPSNSIEYARDRARQLIDRACATLEMIPESESKTAMRTMARFVVERPM